ncbi:hypothetical protein [Archaeoglobus profundus]|uniref:Uncharacterized protein n=1 Tax=Archaeoglobus profundus (strain DSM 5631 / JCM 9629 / NBRC 100127 / Av18) TaxID=572546 RepID=D2RHS6_ARCPA|nr:hypothetical protein [Archaeoglobus profundus]ADB57851.1 Protein of unknown function DUF1102 [Archaeoglobus profundus DSM 5631]
MRRLICGLIIIVSLTMLLGSSGNLREFYGGRNVIVNISCNNSSYVAFTCPEITFHLQNGDNTDVIMLTNNIGKDADFYLYSTNNMLVFSNPIHLVNRETKWISATYNGGYGDHIIPLRIHAEWDGGSADIDACNVHVVSYPVEIKKVLLSGSLNVKTHTLEYWTFRITLKNYGCGDYFTVKDTIPAEFNVSSVNPSNGTYTICEHNCGKMSSTKLNWYVYVGSGEEEYMDVTVYTRLNPAGKQEFTSPGDYNLNDGAEIVGLGIKSDSLVVHAYD